MLSGNMEAIKSFGLHASKTYTLFNGPLECKYLKYDIYSGSKKMKYKEK
jgi:putative N6-adenine-specific DNA methylase